MSMLGFTAEASLYRSTRQYRTAGMAQQTAYGIYPAYLHHGCFLSCYGNCNQECFELTGPARAACLDDCSELHAYCIEQCTFPGDGGGGGGGGPQTECELTATTPEFIRVSEEDLRIVGQGGRHCSGPFPPDARLEVVLNHDRRFWFDPTLDSTEGIAIGFDADLPVSYNCSRGESRNAYVETRNLTTGEKVQSPRRNISCF
jgi:hypothetical protein